MNRSRLEQETIQSYNQEEKEGYVYTFDPKLIRKLRKWEEENPTECRLVKEGPEGSVEYVVPKKWIRVAPSKKRELTEEQIEELKARMAKVREGQKK